ncbi:3-ketoacyl-CoA synthase 6-like [Dendrobium catenatum]|uniref:3-ketoacyl-CoA synthase n=1 Tax=Dendrobium catenatum TaxID=906689 RepID=A0A2I0WWD9_9ASPA|nr:3-ketoacyl-CoA synthase 6-like [Dendrobium catenatum]PKU79961.1 3-ketoacyl-CoA synthase 6 [Dendrobium catenatum]
MEYSLPSYLDYSTTTLLSSLIILAAAYLTFRQFRHRRPPIFLLDFACFKPPQNYRVPYAAFAEHARFIVGEEIASFLVRVLEKSGLGEETALPVGAHYIEPSPRPTMSGSRDEAELVIFSAIDDLLKKTGVDPLDIGVLVINSNSFYPVPSLTSMVVNRYKLRSDIRSYSLASMGCSSGPISIGLARDLLIANPNKGLALVVSTEIITSPSWYQGKLRSMLIPNCLFRLGGAAILLSASPSHRPRSKYQLIHVIRTHLASDDRAYRCLWMEEDDAGHLGISLSKQVVDVASKALELHFATLCPLVLPLSEKLRYLSFLLQRSNKKSVSPAPTFVPEFRRAFDHFCLHAGGKAVVDGLQKVLELRDEEVEATRMSLHRFGNTSSSSVWYGLGYTEAKGRVRKGDRIWQLGLGGGFKCNSAVWRCIRDVDAKEGGGAWADCVHRYPVCC